MLSSNASNYLQQALTMIQENSLHRATIDWESVIAATWQRADGAQEPADTYPAIEFALQQIKDGHSFFRPPTIAQSIQTGSEDSRNRPPTGQLLESNIAYLHVPDFTGSMEAAMVYARTLQQLIGELDARAPIGWMVDLTDNSGGNMVPMLIGLGPLFDREEIGAFVDANGERLPWRYVADAGVHGDGIILTMDAPVVHLQHKPTPIAILLGPSTISSGEIVAIAFRGQSYTCSFGQPTCGLSTANQDFILSDGAEILLTVAVCADRTGRVYGGSINPDVVVKGSSTLLHAVASEWIWNEAQARPTQTIQH